MFPFLSFRFLPVMACLKSIILRLFLLPFKRLLCLEREEVYISFTEKKKQAFILTSFFILILRPQLVVFYWYKFASMVKLSRSISEREFGVISSGKFRHETTVLSGLISTRGEERGLWILSMIRSYLFFATSLI